MARTNTVRKPEPEPLLTESLRATGEALRALANMMDALAIANADGDNGDLLKSSDVQRLLNCGETKARQILRAHGAGEGKMRRIERGQLMRLQREGRI